MTIMIWKGKTTFQKVIDCLDTHDQSMSVHGAKGYWKLMKHKYYKRNAIIFVS